MINCKLYWTNTLVIVLILNDIIGTTLIKSWGTVWLSVAPLFLEGVVLVLALGLIKNEISSIGF